METTHSLINTIKTVPLFEPESSLRGIQQGLLYGKHQGSLYFGTGLTTARSPSIGVPFDLVGMFCGAKVLSDTIGFTKVIQLIADTHALSNSFNTPESVAVLSSQMICVSKRIAKLVHLNYVPILASKIDSAPLYIDILRSIKTNDHEYVRREWADIEFLRRTYDLELKMSWTIGAHVDKIGFDERLYDLRFRDVLGESMSFVYLLPGRTLDIARPKVSPYISVAGERRILLDPNENVALKVEDAQKAQGNDLKSSLKHLENIVNVFEKIHGSIGNGCTVEKVQKLIDLIFS